MKKIAENDIVRPEFPRAVRLWFGVGCALMGLAVCAGAVGAHALRGSLSAYRLEIFEKAALYHLIHGLAIVVCSLAASSGIIASRYGVIVCAIFFTGIVLFSFSLYFLSVTGNTAYAFATPFGGVFLIVGWLVLAMAAFLYPVKLRV